MCRLRNFLHFIKLETLVSSNTCLLLYYDSLKYQFPPVVLSLCLCILSSLNNFYLLSSRSVLYVVHLTFNSWMHYKVLPLFSETFKEYIKILPPNTMKNIFYGML